MDPVVDFQAEPLTSQVRGANLGHTSIDYRVPKCAPGFKIYTAPC